MKQAVEHKDLVSSLSVDEYQVWVYDSWVVSWDTTRGRQQLWKGASRDSEFLLLVLPPELELRGQFYQYLFSVCVRWMYFERLNDKFE